jgi:alkanesulfonate monooxygenase SsuD/methylene tetrahydromethanopterin reductase-like flavin-dependent oxidoreductase (luciferase family)
MPDLRLPALALAAVAKRRRATLDLAKEIEQRGFAGIYCASFGDGLGLSLALALETERIPFGTAIANLYTRAVSDFAHTTALVHELAGGRFRFGVGVSHTPMLRSMGLEAGKPLGDMRRFVEGIRSVKRIGDQPPIVVAGLRKKMVALAGEIAEGVVFANAARSHMQESLSALPAEKRSDGDYFVGNMIPTCISDDVDAAAAVCRRTLTFYLTLPNYRNYWKEAGYVEEMEAVEAALAGGERDRLPELMTDAWLSDCTLFGTAERVREGLAAWYEAGVSTPILVPSSAVGNQMKAFQEIFELFDPR